MANKSYEEILKKLQEESKTLKYTPVEERNSRNYHKNENNSVKSTQLKYNIATNETKNANTEVANTIRTLTPLSTLNNPYKTREKLFKDIISGNRYDTSKEKVNEIITHNTAQEIGGRLMSAPQTSLAYREKLAKQYENSTDFKDSIYEKEKEDFKIKSTNAINAGIEESYAKYSKDLAEAQNKDYNLWDKTGGRFISGMLKTINLNQGPQVKDENGDWYNLPTTQDIKDSTISEKTDNGFLKFTGDVLSNTGRIASSAILNKILPGVGSTAYFSSMYMDGYNNARQNGYDAGKASIYATLSTATELVTEKLLGGATKAITGGKASILNQGIANGISKIMNNKTLINVLSHAGSEATEEFIQEYIDKITRNIVLDEENKVFSAETLCDALYSAAVGAVTGSFASIGDNSLNLPQYNTNLTGISNNNLLNTTSKPILPGINTNSQYSMQDMTINNNNAYQYIKSDNSKIDNLRRSASEQKFNNSEQTTNFINMLEKIVSDKDIDIVFDSNLTSNVNGKYENGKIIINPNSTRAGEFIAVHELTHAIGTDSMRKIVDNYRNSNTQFESALQSILKNYNTTELTDEAMADVAGQLFGNQEFINNLSQTNPSLFKRIYNEIKYLWHQFTGYKNQNQFIEDLQYKWEQAYRNQNVDLNQNTNYSIGGINAINQMPDSKYKQNALAAYQYAQDLSNQNIDNETIRQNTKWFKDKKGDWKFEFDDSTLDLKITPSINKEYKLGNLINHSYLFELYPDLQQYKVEFKDMQSGGKHFYNEKSININNKLINNKKQLLGTLIHEIQHAIQYKEGFNTGTNTLLGRKRYANRLGEIEAADTKKRFIQNLNKEDRQSIAPESSKENPIHPQRKEILSRMNKIEKSLDKLYNLFRGDSDEIVIEDISENKKVDNRRKRSDGSIDRDRRQELDDSSFFNTKYSLSETDLKQKQLDIVLENNPVGDDYHTWIRDIDDIKTFEETLQDPDWSDYVEEGFNPDFTGDMVKEALETGKITVYSSYPIEQGIFVSPSYMEAESYSGDGKVYSKEVNLSDVAWIDPTQGQYAKVNDVKYSLNEAPKQDNQGRTLTKEQQEYFKDSKVRDENGNLEVMYRGDSGDNTINIFDKNMSKKSNLYGTGFYFSDENMASIYGKTTPYYLNIKNPLYVNKDTHNITKEQFSNYIEEAIKNEDYSFENYGNLNTEELINKIYDGRNDFKLINDTVATAIGDYRDAFEIFERANGIKYDGIISNSQTAVFDSNQIKNIDNTNPTTNEDIRYSKQNQTWQEYLEDNFKASGTRTNMQDIKLPIKKAKVPLPKQSISENIEISKQKTMNPNEISKLTKKDASTTPKLPIKKNVNKVGDGNSKFFDNILFKTDMLDSNSKKLILSDEDVKYYDKVTNKESLEKAFNKINNGGTAEVLNWNNKFQLDSEGKTKSTATATDIAEGWILMKQYQDAGDYDSMVQVAKTMRQIGTQAGQTVQAFNILERMTPEGMVKYAQSELSEAYDRMVKNKSKEWIDKYQKDFDLKPEEVAFIMDTMKEVSKMNDGYDKRVKLAEIQKVMTDKLPPEKGAGIKSWMRISMLFNPKTQVRNVLGNAVIAPVNAFSDLFAGIVDKQIAKKTGVRTTGSTSLKNYSKGFKKGLFESYNDFKKGINTRNIQGNRFEISQGKSFNDKSAIGKSLNKVDSLLSFMLDAGDRGFYEASFTNSINNQLVLNNTTQVTQEMVDIATQEALSRTWQDNNGYTKFVLNIRKGLNKINAKGYGLGDILIPFAKTPANLTKAIIDYSPAGLINSIIDAKNLKNSLTNGQFSPQLQHKFVQDLGKATAGTLLYIAGYALAQAGIVSGESDEDKDIANFMKNTLGISNYSIKIGNKSFTYDWAQPIAAPLSIMANFVNKTKQNENASTLENLISSLDVAGNILLEQSFMESINTVLNNNEGVATGVQEAIMELPSRAIPTFMKQIADMVDGTTRTTFEKNKPLETAINKIKVKIPGVSKTLAPSTDTMGREIKKYGGKNNIFNVFLNPANVNTENISESAKEIYEVYKATGEKSVMPRVPEYSYKDKDGNEAKFTANDRSKFTIESGKIIEKEIQNLIKNNNYNSMSSTQKAEAIKSIVDYSYNIAKNKVTGIELSDSYKKAYEYSKIGNISDYYLFKANIDDSSSETKKKSIVNYLTESNLNNKQLAFLYGNYYSSEKTLNNMLNLNIPIKEFIKFDAENVEGEFDENTGRTKTNSKKIATINFVNSLNLNIAQKAYLIRTKYSSFKDYDKDILNYIKKQNIDILDKYKLIKEAQFDSYDSEIVKYVISQSMTSDKKQEILKEMGFTIRNGRVYY